MCFVCSLIPASAFTTFSYLVWFVADATDGMQRWLGQLLAIWLLVVAAGFVVCGAYVTVAKICPMDRLFGGDE